MIIPFDDIITCIEIWTIAVYSV